MKRRIATTLLALSSFSILAQCEIGNGEVLGIGQEYTFAHEPSVAKVAKVLHEDGVVKTIEDAITKAKSYDGVYISLTCLPKVTLTTNNNYKIEGYALVPSWQNLSQYE